jgi:hypothetical protein
MRIVLTAVSSNSEFNGNCDLALVDLTPAYARRIMSRMKAILSLAAADPALSECHYWDSQAEYFEAPREGNQSELLLPAGDTHRVLDAASDLPERLRQRVEYRHLVISVSGGEAEISWRASPKNVPIYVETNPLPQAVIVAVANGGSPATNGLLTKPH